MINKNMIHLEIFQITDQIARLETIAKLSRLIILQSGGEENHLDYSSGQGIPS